MLYEQPNPTCYTVQDRINETRSTVMAGRKDLIDARNMLDLMMSPEGRDYPEYTLESLQRQLGTALLKLIAAERRLS